GQPHRGDSARPRFGGRHAKSWRFPKRWRAYRRSIPRLRFRVGTATQIGILCTRTLTAEVPCQYRREAISDLHNPAQTIHQASKLALLSIVIAVSHQDRTGMAHDLGGHKQEARVASGAALAFRVLPQKPDS